MTQQTYRANLTAPQIPFLSEDHGRSIIMKGQDQNYIPVYTPQQDTDRDLGIPQAIYAHNVMPVTQGFSAVGYESLFPGVEGVTTFQDIFIVRNEFEQRAYFAYTSNGRQFYLLEGASAWVELTSVVGSAGALVTHSHVSGVTYIYFEALGCYYFDFTSNSLVSVSLLGLTASEILGIVGTVGYLIAWSSNAIAWSSVIDPTDFVPSLSTGAGGGSVEGARGKLTLCLAHSAGVIVYTTRNAVAAVYSGNSRYPFSFREIISSGGLIDQRLVVSDANTGTHYAYTTSGLQTISVQAAQIVFPEVTDFLAGERFEDFDEVNLAFTVTNLEQLGVVMRKQLSIISDRYLCISYGITELTHALVYDIAQKRWGKLKVTHVAAFEYSLLDPETTESPKHSFAFLQKNGAVVLLEPEYHEGVSSGILITGKYQYVRSRFITLQMAEFENVRSTDSSFQMYCMPTVDGKNFQTPVLGTAKTVTGNLREYAFRTSCQNFAMIFKGGFSATSLLLTFTVHGRR